MHTPPLSAVSRLALVGACLVLVSACSKAPTTLTQSGGLLQGNTSSSSSFTVPVPVAASSVSSSVRSLGGSVAGQLAIVQEPDREETQPGETVTYTVTVRNVSFLPLSRTFVEATFPARQATLLSASGGIVDGNHIVWDIGSMSPSATKSFTYSLVLSSQLRRGELVTTLVETGADNAVPQISTVEVRVIAALPQTGAETKFFAPIEDTSRFLQPLR